MLSKIQDKQAEKDFFNRVIDLPNIDDKPFYVQRHQKRTAEFVIFNLRQEMQKDNLREVRIFEVGAGGDPLEWIKQADMNFKVSYVAGDIAFMQLLGLQFVDSRVNLDIEALPFKDKTFDFVILKGVLHHFPSLSICIKELMRICRRLVVIVDEPCGSNPLVLFSRLISQLISLFFRIETTPNETMHSIAYYKHCFYQNGAYNVKVFESGKEMFLEPENWHSCLESLSQNKNPFLRLCMFIRSYLQRTLSLFFSKYSFAWNCCNLCVNCYRENEQMVSDV